MSKVATLRRALQANHMLVRPPLACAHAEFLLPQVLLTRVLSLASFVVKKVLKGAGFVAAFQTTHSRMLRKVHSDACRQNWATTKRRQRNRCTVCEGKTVDGHTLGADVTMKSNFSLVLTTEQCIAHSV